SCRKASRKAAAAVAKGTASRSRFLSSYVLQSRADECDHSRGKLFRNVIARSSIGVGLLGSMLALVGVVHVRTSIINESQCRQRSSMRLLSPSGGKAKHRRTKGDHGLRRCKRTGVTRTANQVIATVLLEARHSAHGAGMEGSSPDCMSKPGSPFRFAYHQRTAHR